MTLPDPCSDPALFVALPRITGLALSPDGGAWSRPCSARTRSRRGTSRRCGRSRCTAATGPADPLGAGRDGAGVRPDGSLLFVSARPDPDGARRTRRRCGCCRPRASRGSCSARRGVVRPGRRARAGAVVVLTGPGWSPSTDADDAERRKTRKDRKITAILHTGMPIRHWDHELGADSPRLLTRRTGRRAPPTSRRTPARLDRPATRSAPTARRSRPPGAPAASGGRSP